MLKFRRWRHCVIVDLCLLWLTDKSSVIGMKIGHLVLFQENTFQLVLITNGVYSFAMFNYPSDGLQWSAPTLRYVAVIDTRLVIMCRQ